MVVRLILPIFRPYSLFQANEVQKVACRGCAPVPYESEKRCIEEVQGESDLVPKQTLLHSPYTPARASVSNPHHWLAPAQSHGI
jgi:hypothetical protein